MEESGVCILNIRLPWKHNWEGDRAHDLKLEVSQDTQERLGTENKSYPCVMQSGVIDYFTPEILSAKASENKYYQHCCRVTKYFEFLNKIIFICWHSQLTFTAISCHIGELCRFDEKSMYESACISYICTRSGHLAKLLVIYFCPHKCVISLLWFSYYLFRNCSSNFSLRCVYLYQMGTLLPQLPLPALCWHSPALFHRQSQTHCEDATMSEQDLSWEKEQLTPIQLGQNWVVASH